jgi:hypothetical protein
MAAAFCCAPALALDADSMLAAKFAEEYIASGDYAEVIALAGDSAHVRSTWDLTEFVVACVKTSNELPPDDPQTNKIPINFMLGICLETSVYN